MSVHDLPMDCWYAVSSSESIDRTLRSFRALDRPVVMYRTESGAVAALEDRCAHRAYPLSAGTLDGDLVRCGLCGFVYDVDGECVSVPTQPRVPLGARVDAFPVREAHGLVWLWFGEPGRARLNRIPDLAWLTDSKWVTVAGSQDVPVNFLRLHENFADVTQVPHVAPDISPAVLGVEPPPLDVVVTETTVALRREFPAAPLPAWQADMAKIANDRAWATIQEGYLPSPAVWIDHWDAQSETGDWLRLRFTQCVTPIDQRTSSLMWFVSRDFALDDRKATDTLKSMFDAYYGKVIEALTRAQRVIDVDGPGPEVNVSADAVGLKIREIVSELIAEQGPR